MIYQLGVLLIALLFPLLLGASFLAWIHYESNFLPGKVSVAYLLGTGILSLAMFVEIGLGFSISPLFISTLFVPVLVSLYIKRGFFVSWRPENALKGRPGWELFVTFSVLLSIIIIVLSMLEESLLKPVLDWDSIVLYDFRARVLVRTGSLMKAIEYGYFDAYPLHTSLMHAWFYLLGSATPTPYYVSLYVSVVLLMYAALQNKTGPTIAAIVVLGFSTFPPLLLHATMTYTNLPYLVFYFAAYYHLYLWSNDSKSSNIFLSGLFIAFAYWTRNNEPLWYLVFGLFFVIWAAKGFFLRGISQFLLLSFPIFLVRIAWEYYRKYYSLIPWISRHPNVVGMQPEPTVPHPVVSNSSIYSAFKALLLENPVVKYLNVLLKFDLVQFHGLLHFYYDHIVKYQRKYIIIYLMLLVLVVLSRRMRKGDVVQYIFFAGPLLALAQMFLGLYIFSRSFSEWMDIGGSAERMSYFMIPILFFTLGLLFYEMLGIVFPRISIWQSRSVQNSEAEPALLPEPRFSPSDEMQ